MCPKHVCFVGETTYKTTPHQLSFSSIRISVRKFAPRDKIDNPVSVDDGVFKWKFGLERSETSSRIDWIISRFMALPEKRRLLSRDTEAFSSKERLSFRIHRILLTEQKAGNATPPLFLSHSLETSYGCVKTKE